MRAAVAVAQLLGLFFQTVSVAVSSVAFKMSWEQYQLYLPSCPASFTYSTNSASMASTPMQSPDYAQSLGDGENRSDKKKCRRYKTPSPQLLRRRRSAANERERKRMNTLNVAYDKLRMVLPDLDSGKKLSKFETLQMAQKYIECLADLLKDFPNSNPNKSTVKRER